MGTPRFNVWSRKTEADYNPYGTSYSDRQAKILSGIIPVQSVRLSELAILAKKAERIGDDANQEIALQLYEQRSNPSTYFPSYSLSEARGIIQRLTPWEIEWK